MDTGVRPHIPVGYTPTWDRSDKYGVKVPPPADRPATRIGVIGLGGIAQGKHLPSMARLRATGVPVEVVAGCEADEALRGKVAAEHGFRCYASYEEMLERETLDAVAILTDPGEIRLKVLDVVIERGIHALVEKPFVFLGVERLPEAIEQARRRVARAGEKGLVLMTGFAKRFSPPYRVARELVASGALGELSLIAAKMCQGWSRHILLEGQACHLLDMIRHIGGEVRGVHALAVNRYEEPAYPYDNVVINVAFASGAIGALYFNSSSPSLKPWERLEVFGERKWLAVEDGTTVTLHDSDEGPSKVWAPVFPHTPRSRAGIIARRSTT